MAVRFTKVIERNDVAPSESAAATFNLSEPVPAGMVEMVGLNMQYTSGGASHAANEWGLLKTLTIIYNGNQVFNLTDLAAANTVTTIPALLALVEDIGGYITSSGDSDAVDSWLWIPLGINLGGNSRVEVRCSFVTAAGTGITAPRFSVWHKYGKSSSATVVGNATTVAMSAGSQTQAVIKVPSYPNATVSGIQIQSTTANDMVNAIIKPLGDFTMTPEAIRANAGRNYGSGELYDYLDGATLVQTDGSGSNSVFAALYDYSSADNSIIVLVEATTAENYSFTPVLKVPNGNGNGERTGMQTASVATSGSKSILDRAE